MKGAHLVMVDPLVQSVLDSLADHGDLLLTNFRSYPFYSIPDHIHRVDHVTRVEGHTAHVKCECGELVSVVNKWPYEWPR